MTVRPKRWPPGGRHACKRLDFSWRDWACAARACVSPPPWNAARERLERRFSTAGDALACLSARAGFDLFLRVAGGRWAPGDEIVFTALTIPDMPALARRHGFRPVPLDVDPLTAEWEPQALARLVNPRTRAVVVAHLFGARVDLAATLAIAEQHGLVVIEDCAQAYAGPDWQGHEAADLSLFSFGPLKTATAFGGALARVRDPTVLRAMRTLHRQQPLQGTGEYLRRVFRYGLLQAASTPRVYGAIMALAAQLGVDMNAWANRAVRSLPLGSSTASLRRRPAAANLAVLARRLAQGRAPVARRRAPAQALLQALGPDVRAPTRHAEPHGYWMMPVLTTAPDTLRATLSAHGFEAMPARMAPVADGRHATPGANRLASALCLPFDPSMSRDALQRLGALARPLLEGRQSRQRTN